MVLTTINNTKNYNVDDLTDKDTEMSILGCMMSEPEIIDRLPQLKEYHFSEKINQRIFSFIKNIQKNELAFSKETLLRELVNKLNISEEYVRKKIELHILNCITASVLAINPKGLVNILIELHLKRELLRTYDDLKVEMFKDKHTIKTSDLIEKLEVKLFNISMQGRAEKKVYTIDELIKENITAIEERAKNKDELSGLTTGLLDLDYKLNGLQKSDLIILAARPAMGKTALALNMAFNAAYSLKEKKKSILFFSLEMSAGQLTNRIISVFSGIPLHKIRSGHITQKEFDKMILEYQDRIKGINLFIDDVSSMTVAHIRNQSRKYMRKHNIEAIFIDYLQIIDPVERAHGDNRVNELSKITRQLKQLAKELDVPVVVLSQLSRAVETRDDKRPLLSDLRESGSIEQDADIVLFIYREEYYTRRTQPPIGTTEFAAWQNKMNNCMNQAEIIIAKHRNGAIGNVNLFFDYEKSVFLNLENKKFIAQSFI